MLPQSRPTKRPRLALSCVVCRRRKVRCGKEQPQCNNCVRIGENCVYNVGSRDPETGRILRETEDTESTGRLSSTKESPRGKHESTLKDVHLSPPKDYLSKHRGARQRYIGRTFWGSVSGQEKLNDSFFYDERAGHPDLPPPHILSMPLARSFHSLPIKAVSDIFLQSFLVGVHPLCPLVDVPAFQVKYQDFWRRCEESSLFQSPELVEDPTFSCLLWAILYTGASVALDATWTSALKDLNRTETVRQLRTSYSDGLNACRHTEHPTLNTLIASMLVYHFMPQEALGSSLFVVTTCRLAQSMGLHQDDLPGSRIPQKYQRRVWWYIIWLDVQTSLASGLPTCCGETADRVQMVSSFKDSVKDESNRSMLPDTSSSSDISVIMQYAIGRYETARLQGRLIHRIQSAHALSQQTIAEIITMIKELRLTIDNLIAKLPVHGVPEKGMIPSRLANASPLTNSTYFEDQTNEPGVLSTWVRIMLSLLKLEVVITLQKTLLSPPESPGAPASWDSTVRLCLDYLQIYLHLCRTPAFEPYSWFCVTYYGPQQCALLILLWLNQHHTKVANEQEMRYCVDEFIDYCTSRQSASDDTKSENLPLKVLIRLRKQLDSESGEDTRTTGSSFEGMPGPQAISTAIVPTNTVEEVDSLADIFDFDNWSMSLS
ncbi:uncharacterized protein N7459_008688 [Penicillium hispanicum]|uniref:uncharacterized protein n=1 Tax=Penicillium hispanicum TaxID=1080232 RepID=UPI0025424723|nr:uncharacterized protein N7459_008688 [Penicillium hispanicum]KAJ5574261.1 hypothetical protein N7459_008688 [Penicillium hispanicum]